MELQIHDESITDSSKFKISGYFEILLKLTNFFLFFSDGKREREGERVSTKEIKLVRWTERVARGCSNRFQFNDPWRRLRGHLLCTSSGIPLCSPFCLAIGVVLTDIDDTLFVLCLDTGRLCHGCIAHGWPSCFCYCRTQTRWKYRKQLFHDPERTILGTESRRTPFFPATAETKQRAILEKHDKSIFVGLLILWCHIVAKRERALIWHSCERKQPVRHENPYRKSSKRRQK